MDPGKFSDRLSKIGRRLSGSAQGKSSSKTSTFVPAVPPERSEKQLKSLRVSGPGKSSSKASTSFPPEHAERSEKTPKKRKSSSKASTSFPLEHAERSEKTPKREKSSSKTSALGPLALELTDMNKQQPERGDSENRAQFEIDCSGVRKQFWVSRLAEGELSIPFATFDEQKCIHLNDAALQLLMTIKKPVALLSICGPYRSGKSYYLSRLLKDTSTFKTSQLSDACTRGIWMATSCLECKDFVIILLDTEGTGSLEGDEVEGNVKNYIVLSTLLSSFLVYNSTGAPTQHSLKEMSFLAQLAESFVVRSNDDFTTEDRCKKYFPDFLWLLRDCNLQSTDKNGAPITFTAHITNKILQPTGQSTTQNAISRTLLTLFPSLECRQIPHPWCNEDLATTPVEKLHPEFNRSIEESIKYILSTIRPRKGIDNNIELDGTMLAKLSFHYAQALNEPNGTLNLEVSYEYAVRQKVQQVMEALTQEYQHEMKQVLDGKFPIEEGPLQPLKGTPDCDVSGEATALFDIHRRIFSVKRDTLERQIQKYMANPSFVSEREQLLNGFVDRIVKVVDNDVKEGILHSFVAKNYQESHASCLSIFDDMYESQSETNLQMLKRDYLERAIGPAKLKVLHNKFSEIPMQPTDLTSTEQGSEFCVIKWNLPNSDSQQINKYFEVEVKQGANPSFVFRSDSKPPTKVPNLIPNARYILRVRACGSRYKGEYSKQEEIKTLAGKPSKPHKPFIDPKNSAEVTVRVEPPSRDELKGARDIDDIIIEQSFQSENEVWKETRKRVSRSSGIINVDMQVPSVPDDCRSIYYRVSIVTIGGKSEPSEVVRISLLDLIPGVPTNMVHLLDPENKTAKLSWNAPECNKGSVSFYEIRLKGNDPKLQPLNVRRTNCTLSGLKPVMQYEVEVYACNNKHHSSPAVMHFTTEAAKPAKPATPRIQVDCEDITQAILNIERLSKEGENGSPVTAIVVERRKGEFGKWTRKRYKLPNSDRIIKQPVPVDNATDTKTMYYHVMMVNAKGEGPASEKCTLEYSQMIPGEPQHLCAYDVTNNSIALKWEQPIINPKSVDYYCVEMKCNEQGDDAWSVPPQETNVKQRTSKVPNLNHNTKYNFRIIAYNRDKLCSPTNKCSIEESTKPCAPSKPEISNIKISVIDPTTARATIPKPDKEDTGSEVTGITCVKCGENGEVIHGLREDVQIQNHPGNIIFQNFSIDDRTHYLRISLANEYGESPMSEYICVSPNDIKPGPPEMLQLVECGYNYVTLSWKPPNKQARAAKGYSIQKNDNLVELRWKEAEFHHQVDKFTHSAEVYNLLPSTKYFFYVCAVNGQLESEMSKVIVATTTAGRPEKPQPLQVSQLDNCPNKARVVIPRPEKKDENGSPILKVKIESCDEHDNWLFRDVKDIVQEDTTPNIALEIDLPSVEEKKVKFLFFRAKMVNSVGDSEPSERFALEVSQISPGKITSLETANVSAHGLTLKWNPPQWHQAVVHGYVIERKESESGGWKEEFQLNEDQVFCSIPNLKCHTEYRYRVSARSSTKKGPSVSVVIKTVDLPPQAPVFLREDRKWSDAIKIRWGRPPGDPESNDAYRVVVKDKKDVELKTYYTRGYSKAIKELTPYTTYKIEVAGVSKSKTFSQNNPSIAVTTALSGKARVALTVVGTAAFVVGGIAAYQGTKPDDRNHLVESDSECDESYVQECENLVNNEENN